MKFVLVLLVACGDRHAPIESCKQDLSGAYDAGDDRHWMVLDRGIGLEVYPLFADVPAVAGLEVAPRVIDLDRENDQLVGHVRRRYMRQRVSCNAKAMAHVTACKDDAIELVIADPEPPLSFEPCRFASAPPSRRERWQRE